MPTPKQGSRFDGSASYQKKTLASLVKQLIGHGKVRTTDIEAKLLRPYVKKLITKAKRGTLADRHNVIKLLDDNYAVKRLFNEIGPQFADHDGDYTRIIRLGSRKGDNAPISLIALAEEGIVTAEIARTTRIAISKRAEEAKAKEVKAEVTEKE